MYFATHQKSKRISFAWYSPPGSGLVAIQASGDPTPGKAIRPNQDFRRQSLRRQNHQSSKSVDCSCLRSARRFPATIWVSLLFPSFPGLNIHYTVQILRLFHFLTSFQRVDKKKFYYCTGDTLFFLKKKMSWLGIDCVLATLARRAERVCYRRHRVRRHAGPVPEPF